MKFGFQFSNLCGTVYKQGNLIFTRDGNSLLSPVGNRVSVFDLVNNKSFTLPCEARKNVAVLAISPNGHLLIAVDEEGHALLIHLTQRAVLHHFNFKEKVSDLRFSPDGSAERTFFVVTHGKRVQVWHSPSVGKEFAPFVLHRTYAGPYDDAVCLGWSPDSRFFLVGCRDLTARLYSVDPIEGFTPVTMSGHRDVVVGAFFSASGDEVYTVGRDGALFVWSQVPQGDGSSAWRITAKHYFNQSHARVVSCAFHAPGRLLVVGFTNGVFALYELPEFNMIHSLSISHHRVTTVAINSTGEWLAFGCASLGQLLVWEWQSETYVLRQQSHAGEMSALAYSPDGQTAVTGGEDGKVKAWNTTTGFCFVTFSEHTGGVTAVAFAAHGNAVFTASLDGTVRAFDLVRYRNFRTFTSPSPAQFSSLAVESSGDVICAGSLDTFEVFVWAVQTGRLLEVLTGHEGPVSGLSFAHNRALLASCSWDRTVRFWDVFEGKGNAEVLQHGSDCLTVAFRPDDQQLCVSTLDGTLHLWDVRTSQEVGTIEGRRDLAGGRKAEDRVTAKNSAAGKAFESICYSADGRCLLAGGASKYVCIYELSQRVLLKRFRISENRALDGVLDKLNSRNMAEGGPLDAIEHDSGDERDRMGTGPKDPTLPGVKSGDLSARKTRPEVRTKAVRFSPTGRAWAAASTEGLLIYSLDASIVFDPFDLDVDITPDAIHAATARGDHLAAIAMAVRLGERAHLFRALEAVPPSDVVLVAQQMPPAYVDRLLSAVAAQLDASRHIQFYLEWCASLLVAHGRMIRNTAQERMTVLRDLHKSLTRQHDDIARVCDDNVYTLQYVLTLANASANAAQSQALAANGEGSMDTSE